MRKTHQSGSAGTGSDRAPSPRPWRSNRSFLSVVLVFGLLAGSCQSEDVSSPPSTVPALTSPTLTSPTLTTERRTTTTTPEAEVGEVVEVASVTDGDTIRVIMGDETNEPVRLIGIDAPEDGSPLDQEATRYLEELLAGGEVRMVRDLSDRDSFGRLLRYLYVGDIFVNERMVRRGLAIAKRYAPDVAMASVLEAAQGGAERGALGLFSPDLAVTTTSTSASTTTTTRAPTTTTTQPSTTSTLPVTTTTGAPANCHSSYPDFCIPPAPPDLDCGDIGANNFTVLSPDPHGFDGNDDGVGCES